MCVVFFFGVRVLLVVVVGANARIYVKYHVLSGSAASYELELARATAGNGPDSTGVA